MDGGLELCGLVSALFPVYLATLSGSICLSGGGRLGLYVHTVTAEKCVWVLGWREALQSGDAATSGLLSDL